MASPAHAQTTPTECTGTLGAVTVSGVTVPDGVSCVLDGTTVEGSVTVGAAAALRTTNDVTVKRNLALTASGRLLADTTTVWGDVVSTGTGLIRFTDSVVVGNVTVRQDTSFGATGLGVGGNLRGSQVNRFDLTGSAVWGTFAVDEAFAGSNFCGNLVRRNAEFRGSGTAIQIGGAESCAGNKVGGNVVVENNVAEITITGNTIYHDLNCVGNDPAPAGSGNDVQGSSLGQCATL